MERPCYTLKTSSIKQNDIVKELFINNFNAFVIHETKIDGVFPITQFCINEYSRPPVADERETQKSNTNNKTKAEKSGGEGTKAIRKGSRLNGFVVHLS